MKSRKTYNKQSIKAIKGIIEKACTPEMSQTEMADILNINGLRNAQGEPFNSSNISNFVCSHMRKRRKRVATQAVPLATDLSYSVEVVEAINKDKTRNAEQKKAFLREYLGL